MASQRSTDPQRIEWRLHLRAPPAEVFTTLTQPERMQQFWVESAEVHEGTVEMVFPNGVRQRCRMLERTAPRRFTLEYFGGSIASFELTEDGAGGTDLRLAVTNVAPELWNEDNAGWVSVLLCLKAAVDHGVDLRNHDPARTWDQDYVDN
jgi:uncharacterized protein YndB with AHSA1/START domain